MEAGPASDNLTQLLETAARQFGVSLAPPQIDQLAIHFRLLLQWNSKINLSAVRRPEEIAVRHFGESLFLSTLIAPPEGLVLDVGSGGGFPALPLKVMWPQAGFLLLEPNLKKATFLREVVRQSRLNDVQVLTRRLEDDEPPLPVSGCTLATLRAVAVGPAALESLYQLLVPGGLVAFFLGADDAARLSAAGPFNWQPPHPVPHAEQRVILLGRR